ncbi:OmpA family protein [Paradesertivirga mongoliensis]|uniref:OmpA family protein n=1 Tax=Paradesertivirga mongoliensis TaxID=2100740 RepID=UPI00210CE783
MNTPYSFSSSPKGFGLSQEFPRSTKKSAYYFEQERNTIWLALDIPFNGILTFEIKPHRASDDYDWMLFENNPNLKENIKQDKPLLLRSNNSRNDPKIQGKTGTKDGAWPIFEAPGPGRSYSKAILVKRGQRLALIIDNIYESGAGFDFVCELRPRIISYRMLSGAVADENTGTPLGAQIFCEDDSTGVRLAETVAEKNGTYKLQIPAGRPLNITAAFPGYLFETSDLDLDATVQDFKLSKIEDTQKLLLFNIHFRPDKDLLSPNSEPELGRLVEFLKIRKNWNIRITGHTNNNPFADAGYLQRLSFNRAIAVKQYLMKKGIAEKRLSCAGMGGKRPIVSGNAEQSWQNLRVEVTLTR